MARSRAAIVLIETTVPARQAARLAEALVADRLAACAHWGPIRSTYWWKGKREDAREALLCFKTTAGLAGRLVARLRGLHPHEVPYVAEVPLGVRVPSYAAWVRNETRARRGTKR